MAAETWRELIKPACGRGLACGPACLPRRGPAEETDPPAATDEQVFPDYDNCPDPEPVYD